MACESAPLLLCIAVAVYTTLKNESCIGDVTGMYRLVKGVTAGSHVFRLALQLDSCVLQGFSRLPHAGSLKFPSQPYNYVERVSYHTQNCCPVGT